MSIDGLVGNPLSDFGYEVNILEKGIDSFIDRVGKFSKLFDFSEGVQLQKTQQGIIKTKWVKGSPYENNLCRVHALYGGFNLIELQRSFGTSTARHTN